MTGGGQSAGLILFLFLFFKEKKEPEFLDVLFTTRLFAPTKPAANKRWSERV